MLCSLFMFICGFHIKAIVGDHGAKNWKKIAEQLGDRRTDVQCLHRWNKVLKPGLLKGPWTAEEVGEDNMKMAQE